MKEATKKAMSASARMGGVGFERAERAVPEIEPLHFYVDYGVLAIDERGLR